MIPLRDLVSSGSRGANGLKSSSSLDPFETVRRRRLRKSDHVRFGRDRRTGSAPRRAAHRAHRRSSAPPPQAAHPHIRQLARRARRTLPAARSIGFGCRLRFDGVRAAVGTFSGQFLRPVLLPVGNFAPAVLAGLAADLTPGRRDGPVLHDILRPARGAGQDHLQQLFRRFQRVNRNARPLARRRAHARSCRTRRGGPLSAIVEFDSVGLRYGTGAEVLRDLDFRLAKGGFYFLTGPSGAGKTSLLQLLYLAQRPTRGRIQLFGRT